MSPFAAEPVLICGRATGRERTLNPLPASWQWTTIGDVANVFRGASPRPKGDPRYFGGPIPWIMISDLSRQPGKYLYMTNEGVTEAGAALSRRLPPGTLILSNSATVCVPKILKTEGCIHDGFVSFDGLEHCVSLDCAYWWFEFVRPYIIQENRQGVTQVNLNTDIVRDIHIPIPPRPEQDRIVAEIEKQLARLDAAVAALKRAQANLKRYRAAVIKAAVECRLVPTEADLARREGRSYEPASELLKRILAQRRSRWEAAQLANSTAKPVKRDERSPSRYAEPIAPPYNATSRSPEGWTEATVEQVSSLVQYGSSAKTKEKVEGVPVLRMGNITSDGRLDLAELKYLPANHDEFPELLLEPGDLLFNRTNSAELVGKSAVYGGAPVPCSFASYLIRVKALPGCDPRYLALCINSHLGRNWIKSVVSQQVGQANVNGTKLQTFAFPLPPASEQGRIMNEVDRTLSVVEEQDLIVQKDLLRAERLRQAILKRAFEGKLVPQDPADEPASILLGRIRAEREAKQNMAGSPRNRKRGAKAHVTS